MTRSRLAHWGNDAYWADAFESYFRDHGTETGEIVDPRTMTLDLDAIERRIFEGDSPAYRLIDAMVSVKEREGFDGYRGAPRLILALLMHLKELSDTTR